MPNLQKVLKEAPEYRSMITAQDGHIYAFPWIEELGSEKESIHSVNDMPWINVEWLKKLGLKMPKTTEDLKKFCSHLKMATLTEMAKRMKSRCPLCSITAMRT